jgi:O-acetyl-ADP-ribose deacetylase (regulator of RNase III)
VSLTAILADITTLEVDAIVNAANERLAAGGGVCGAIFQAAGPGLAEACAALGGCRTGEARATPAFRLPARIIIHAVGPVWRGGGHGEAALLASAYRASMRLAAAQGAASIAFPALSTGIYGFPVREAASIAVATLRGELAAGSPVTRVVLACFNADVLAAYRAAGIWATGDDVITIQGDE